jgi:hypothetical protein
MPRCAMKNGFGRSATRSGEPVIMTLMMPPLRHRLRSCLPREVVVGAEAAPVLAEEFD